MATSFSPADAKSDPVRRSLGAGGCKKQRECFQHNIQLQLADSTGFPVVPPSDNAFCDGGTHTRFWVTLDIIKDGPLVTINIPLINFQTGQVSVNSPLCPNDGLVEEAISTLLMDSCQKKLHTNDLVPRSIVAASNNGLSPVFSLPETPSQLPVPPIGYIVQITNAGELQVQCAGTFGNIIPAGPQILMPCSITYLVKPSKKLCDNIVLSTGPTNTTQFTSRVSANEGFRDTHFNDAFDGVLAWAWTDNSMVADKTNGTMNCMVAIGKVGKDGKLQIGAPIQLTDFPPEQLAWDTSVAINRKNPDNIVVSYGFIDNNFPTNAILTVDSPASIAGDYQGLAGLLFPLPWHVPNAAIVPADPLNADTPLVNGAQIAGNIALIAADGFQTGSVNKCNNAFNAGAIGAIIYNNSNAFSSLINGSPFIPSMLVTLDTGLAILNNLPVVGSMQGD